MTEPSDYSTFWRYNGFYFCLQIYLKILLNTFMTRKSFYLLSKIMKLSFNGKLGVIVSQLYHYKTLCFTYIMNDLVHIPQHGSQSKQSHTQWDMVASVYVCECCACMELRLLIMMLFGTHHDLFTIRIRMDHLTVVHCLQLLFSWFSWCPILLFDVTLSVCLPKPYQRTVGGICYLHLWELSSYSFISNWVSPFVSSWHVSWYELTYHAYIMNAY